MWEGGIMNSFETGNPVSGFPSGASGKESACQCRTRKRHGFDPWVEKIPWRRKWHLQYSCLENPMDRGAWWATVHGVAKRQTRLSRHARTLFLLSLLFNVSSTVEAERNYLASQADNHFPFKISCWLAIALRWKWKWSRSVVSNSLWPCGL